jgi:hypothetical protein
MPVSLSGEGEDVVFSTIIRGEGHTPPANENGWLADQRRNHYLHTLPLATNALHSPSSVVGYVSLDTCFWNNLQVLSVIPKELLLI